MNIMMLARAYGVMLWTRDLNWSKEVSATAVCGRAFHSVIVCVGGGGGGS